ncbi:MAG TPA: hypothetical protein PLK99_00355 [Burkholderiales bacterium]|nr:hypothetical protein [Burkholderiales bacterium]
MRLFAACLAAFSLSPAFALADSPFTLKGFGTVGMARSSNGDAQFIRDISQPQGVGRNWSGVIDSLAGLQGNYQFNDATEMIAQVVSHYRYDGTFSPELTRAMIKYDWNPRLFVRIGRIGTELLMHSDSRWVGYSYLTVRPNVDFFGSIPVNYADGLEANYHVPLADGILEGNIFGGTGREYMPDYPLDHSHLLEGSIGYSKGNWQLRYLYGQIELERAGDSLAPIEAGLLAAGAGSAANSFDLVGSIDRYNSLAAIYDDGTWQVQASLCSIQHQKVFQNEKSWYLLAGRRYGDLTPFAGYSSVRSTSKSIATGIPSASPFAYLNGSVAYVTNFHQQGHTLTLGARWDFMRNVDLKAQVDFIGGGDGTSNLLYRNIQPGWDGKTTVMSLALDFIF